MCKLERRLLAAGGVLIKMNHHRIYEFKGVRYTFSHSKKSCENRDRMKPLVNLLNNISKR